MADVTVVVSKDGNSQMHLRAADDLAELRGAISKLEVLHP